MSDIQRKLLEKTMCEDEKFRRLWYGHLRDLNPEAEREVEREQWAEIGRDVLCICAFFGFVAWLVTYA